MNRSTFLKHLRQSDLLAEEQLTEALGRLAPKLGARALARALVAEGLLTRLQAKRLLAGKGRSLRLGPYVLLERLGRGGMGQVFKAVHTTMDRVVAIKLILPKVLKDPRALNLFNREVRAAAQLHHPNIVEAYHADEVNGTHFMVMEYVDGPNLHDVIRQQGPLPVGLACELMRQAAEALQFAYENWVVHRDIKPANLIIAQLPAPPPAGEISEPAPSTPVLKIGDFGLARLHTGGKGIDTIPIEAGTVHGSIDFISPEQGQDVHAVDIRSDLYSLGCTFYYAITGQLPFPAGSFLEKLVQHLMHEPRPLREVCPEVPEGVAAIIHRLMAKNQAERYQTPGELARDLAPWCGKDGMLATLPAAAPAETPADAVAPEENPRPEDTQETIRLFHSHPADAAAFRENWRRWTYIVEYIVSQPNRRRRIKEQAFRTLRAELLEACAARAAASSEDNEQRFLRSLELLVAPWLTPEVLARAEHDILHDVLRRSQEVEAEFDKWIPLTPGSAEDTQPLVARLRSRYQERARRLEFEEDLRRNFGVGP